MAPGAAEAHTTNLTRSLLRAEGEILHYRLTLSAHDLAVALGIETDLVAAVPQAAFEEREGLLLSYLETRLDLGAEGRPCVLTEMTPDYTPLPEEIRIEMRYRCEKAPGRLILLYGLFFDLDPRHQALGRIETAEGATVSEFLLDRSLTRHEAEISAAAPPEAWSARFSRIFLLGLEHILIGADHLLFLLALLLATRGLGALVALVTAFTLAHSVTLGLAWAGVLALPARPVEIAIALSIAWVAGENLVRPDAGRRWIVAGLFGLVHGLGFYGVLSDLDLAGAGAVTTLLAFNLGIEAGQVAFVLLLALPLLPLRGKPWFPTAVRAASVPILLVALWWTFERSFLA